MLWYVYSHSEATSWSHCTHSWILHGRTHNPPGTRFFKFTDLHAVNAFLWCVWWCDLNADVLPCESWWAGCKVGHPHQFGNAHRILARWVSFSHEITNGEHTHISPAWQGTQHYVSESCRSGDSMWSSLLMSDLSYSLSGFRYRSVISIRKNCLSIADKFRYR